MKGTVTNYVASCQVCQKSKYQASSPAGLLQPLPIPENIWEEISMDFIVKLPKIRGYEVILVVVDRLSKYGHFIPLKHPFTAKTVATIFTKEIIKLHGIPISIVSDRDPLFLSSFWQEIFKLQGTKLKMSTAYHPQSDGQTEVLNRTLETYLRCFCSEQPKGWLECLPWAEYWYNTSHQQSAKCSPFEIVYGRPPPTITKFVAGETCVEAVAQDLMTRDEALKQLKFHLHKAQEQMRKFANAHRKPSTIKVGDKVFLKVRPHRQVSMPTKLHPKLAARYYGPYLVTKQIGAVAFQLQLPASARIHPVFHVSQLKLAIGDHPIEEHLPEEMQGTVETYEPEEVLNRRQLDQHGNSVQQILIKWKGLSTEEATWEDEATLKNQFPQFNLEDKVPLKREGIVRPLITYARKNKKNNN